MPRLVTRPMRPLHRVRVASMRWRGLRQGPVFMDWFFRQVRRRLYHKPTDSAQRCRTDSQRDIHASSQQ